MTTTLSDRPCHRAGGCIFVEGADAGRERAVPHLPQGRAAQPAQLIEDAGSPQGANGAAAAR
jgi:hypothetical protein